MFFVRTEGPAPLPVYQVEWRNQGGGRGQVRHEQLQRSRGLPAQAHLEEWLADCATCKDVQVSSVVSSLMCEAGQM